MTRSCVVVLLMFSSMLSLVKSFQVGQRQLQQQRHQQHQQLQQQQFPVRYVYSYDRSVVPLFSSSADGAHNDQESSSTSSSSSSTTSENDENQSEKDSADESANANDADNEATAPRPVDPELVALKNEIMRLEDELSGKRGVLTVTTDRLDDYSNKGYARKVAQLEMLRRDQNKLQTSNKDAAEANVLKDSFVPVLDRLIALKQRYGNDPFGSQYNALELELRTAFTKLGVTEFAIAAGDALDLNRMQVERQVYSDTAPANTVLQIVTDNNDNDTTVTGLELKGNVIKKVPCIISLGPEPVPEQETQEQESSVDNDKDNKDTPAEESSTE